MKIGSVSEKCKSVSETRDSQSNTARTEHALQMSHAYLSHVSLPTVDFFRSIVELFLLIILKDEKKNLCPI